METHRRIQKAREAREMTRQELAQRLGVSYWAVCKYETGERVPPQDVLIKIANTLGVSADYLLGRMDEPRPKRVELPDYVKDLSPNLQDFLKREAEAGWPRLKILFDADLRGLSIGDIDKTLRFLLDLKRREEEPGGSGDKKH